MFLFTLILLIEFTTSTVASLNEATPFEVEMLTVFSRADTRSDDFARTSKSNGTETLVVLVKSIGAMGETVTRSFALIRNESGCSLEAVAGCVAKERVDGGRENDERVDGEFCPLAESLTCEADCGRVIS